MSSSCSSSDIRRSKKGLKPLYRDGHRRLGTRYWPVERVALKWDAAGLGNESDQVLAAQHLRRGGAGVVINLFLHHGAIDVVGAEAQRDLRHLRSDHLPIRLDVREVVEHQPRDRDLFQVEHTGGLR